MRTSKVPFHWQTTDYSCGPAALRMVYDFWGARTAPAKLIAEVKSNPKTGTDNKYLIQSARRRGFYVYVNNESTIFELKHFIAMNLPPIVDFIEPSENVGHYAVVTGYKQKQLIFNDSWNGKDFELSERSFLKRWHDESNIHKRWLFVVSKYDMHFGKQYKPLKKR